jgi:hypothetical protein
MRLSGEARPLRQKGQYATGGQKRQGAIFTRARLQQIAHHLAWLGVASYDISQH